MIGQSNIPQSPRPEGEAVCAAESGCGSNWVMRGVILAVVILILDQLTKWVMLAEVFVLPEFQGGFFDFLINSAGVAPLEVKPVTGFLNWVIVWNYGVSFGLFSQYQEAARWILVAVTGSIALGFSVWLTRARSPLLALPLGAVIGGAIGNILDRLRFGAVYDFIDVHVAGWHYPAFNIADAGISIGMMVLVVYMIWFEPKANQSQAENKETKE